MLEHEFREFLTPPRLVCFLSLKLLRLWPGGPGSPLTVKAKSGNLYGELIWERWLSVPFDEELQKRLPDATVEELQERLPSETVGREPQERWKVYLQFTRVGERRENTVISIYKEGDRYDKELERAIRWVRVRAGENKSNPPKGEEHIERQTKGLLQWIRLPADLTNLTKTNLKRLKERVCLEIYIILRREKLMRPSQFFDNLLMDLVPERYKNYSGVIFITVMEKFRRPFSIHSLKAFIRAVCRRMERSERPQTQRSERSQTHDDKVQSVADEFGCHPSTIYRHIRRRLWRKGYITTRQDVARFVEEASREQIRELLRDYCERKKRAALVKKIVAERNITPQAARRLISRRQGRALREIALELL